MNILRVFDCNRGNTFSGLELQYEKKTQDEYVVFFSYVDLDHIVCEV